MIIKNIQSNNFLKYENLNLNNLPDQGLITISGQNESGKTSIGETLCFALFGRTFTLDLSDPRKLIRWGASQCSVSLTFTVEEIDSENKTENSKTGNNNETYTVERYLDNEGTYGAKLARNSDGATLAKGPDKVSGRILELINFGYNEFVESFYLAQRELTTPQPHSQTIKVMAGIAPLSNIHKQITSTINDEHAQLDHLKNDFDEVDASYTELALDVDWMPELQTSLAATSQEIESRKELNEKLLAGSKSYNTALPIVQKKQRNKSRITFFSLILFLLTLVSWAAWFFLMQEPQSAIATNIESWIQNQLTNEFYYQQWLLPAAITSSILLLLNLILSVKNTRKLRSAQQQAIMFSTSLTAVKNHSNYEYTDRISEFLLQHRQAGDFPANDDNTLDFQQSDVITRSQSFLVSEDESNKITTEITDAQLQRIEDSSNHKQALEHAIQKEQERLDTGNEFTEIMNSLESRTQELSHLLDVKNVAVELLESAGHHLSHKFNQSILKLAGDALPSFTQGRYKHLKIDDTMNVRVFSSEKGDFLDLDEVSSGTQRQIMLSLRLAMSQALINAIECSPQFIFLDEPFAFFDQERIRDTIATLPSFSKDIKQIWLVSQEFPEAINADLHIECNRDKPALTFNT